MKKYDVMKGIVESLGINKSHTRVATTALLWLLSYTATTISTVHALPKKGKNGDNGRLHVTDWLFLSVLQAGVAGIVALVCSRYIIDARLHARKNVIFASLANTIGLFTLNLAFSLFPSSTNVLVIKSSEFVFTFIIAVVSKRKYYTWAHLVTIFIIVQGNFIYFNPISRTSMYALAAAFVSNTAFALRNIFLQFHESKRSNEKFAVMTMWSLIFSLPVFSFDFKTNANITNINIWMLIAIVSYILYNLLSVVIIRHASSSNYSALTLMKCIFAIVIHLIYFSIFLSVKMKIGIVVLFCGLALFVYVSYAEEECHHKSRNQLSKKIWVLILILLTFYVGIRTDKNIALNENKPKNIFTSWVYNKDVPSQFVEEVKWIAREQNNSTIFIYCATTRCMKACETIRSINVKVEFLYLYDLIKDTAFHEWMKKLPLIKLLAGERFEDLLQHVIRLSLLYKYGGIFVNLKYRLSDSPLFFFNTTAWIARNPQLSLLDICYFPQRSHFLLYLSEALVDQYTLKHNLEQCPKNFQLDEHINTMYQKYHDRQSCEKTVITDVTVHNVKKMLYFVNKQNHFATLSFQSRGILGGGNIGDEIQGYAGMQFLPYIDTFIDRKNLTVPTSQKTSDTVVFLNAWWGNPEFNWPPKNSVSPQLISMHLQSVVWPKFSQYISYLKDRKPIGARDFSTLYWLQSQGVPSYFSGCLTLFLRNYYEDKDRSDEIYVVDVKPEYQRLIPSHIEYKKLTHDHKDKRFNVISLYSISYERIEMYSRAKLVITQRIHAALPCVALGTPVIFINTPNMPGAGGSAKQASPRTTGLTGLFHTLNMYQTRKIFARIFFKEFNWNNPPPNPGYGLLMKLRATQWNVLRRNPIFYDSAKRFGLIPPTTIIQAELFKLDIHMVYHSSTGQTTRLDNFSLRVVESLLHHHPSAQLMIYHTNKLEQKEFDVLSEVGYNIRIKTYNLKHLIEQSNIDSLKKFIERPNIMQCQHLPLIKLLLLYNVGGVFIEQNVIVTKPFLLIQQNTLDGINTSVISFMKFEKQNPLVKKMADLYVERYHHKEDCTNYIQSSLLNPFIGENPNTNQPIIRHLSREDVTKCVKDTVTLTEESHGIAISQVDLERNFNMYNTSRGSTCNYLLNEFCVLCSILY
ncbi:uncharacterized protein LOC130614495 [Hydractinia symbiolongicarpus]|uniref:uncharacterized protein LOC130614495 n=1 Tax=Hydractinia symbiolongicarpus TaxID=13093 RepID=UPI002549E635|nr:uncharacterized protein LOC130614495 [Hydractinia symbiolongicarpus]